MRLVLPLCLMLVTALCQLSYADQPPIHQLYEKLRNTSADLEGEGGEDNLIEQIAILALRERYPSPKYFVGHNILYKTEHRVYGELDAVVWDVEQNVVIEIVEVKNQNNTQRAIRAAQLQLDRIRSELARRTPIVLTPKNFKQELDLTTFHSEFSTSIMGNVVPLKDEYKIGSYAFKRKQLTRLLQDVRGYQRQRWLQESHINLSFKNYLKYLAHKEWLNAPRTLFASRCETEF